MSRSVARLTPALWLGATFALAAAGCAKRHHITVESNICWLAVIDRQSDAVISDCGSKNFRVAGEVHCVKITGLADTGFVRVRIDDGVWATTAAHGTVETCR